MIRCWSGRGTFSPTRLGRIRRGQGVFPPQTSIRHVIGRQHLLALRAVEQIHAVGHHHWAAESLADGRLPAQWPAFLGHHIQSRRRTVPIAGRTQELRPISSSRSRRNGHAESGYDGGEESNRAADHRDKRFKGCLRMKLPQPAYVDGVWVWSALVVSTRYPPSVLSTFRMSPTEDTVRSPTATRLTSCRPLSRQWPWRSCWHRQP